MTYQRSDIPNFASHTFSSLASLEIRKLSKNSNIHPSNVVVGACMLHFLLKFSDLFMHIATGSGHDAVHEYRNK